MTLDQGHSDVATLWQHVRRFATRPALWLDLARGYAERGLLWQAGYAARQAYRLDASLLVQLQALKLGAWQDAHAGDAWLGGLALANVGADAGALMQRFAQAVAQCPGDWLTWLYLARLREMPGGEFLAHLGPDPLDRPDRRCLCGRSRGAGARCCPSAPGPRRIARANGRIAFVRHQQLCACL